MKPPRGLSASEAALWQAVARTVTPLTGMAPSATEATASPLPRAGGPVAAKATISPDRPSPNPSRKREGNFETQTLDGTWERKLTRAQIAPDFEIDLHGLGLDAAHGALMRRLGDAVARGARLVLVIAGKHRPRDDHGFERHEGRGSQRGAIRAKLLDWLAASPHAARIAAVRPAAQRHGGAGAVYVVLRRAR